MAFGIHIGLWVLAGWRMLVPVLLPSSPSTTHQPALGHTGVQCHHSTPPQHPAGSQSTQHSLLGAMGPGNPGCHSIPSSPSSLHHPGFLEAWVLPSNGPQHRGWPRRRDELRGGSKVPVTRTTNPVRRSLIGDASGTGSAPNCAPGHPKLPLHPSHVPRVEPRHPDIPCPSSAASSAVPQFPQPHPAASPGLAAAPGRYQAGGIQLLPRLFVALVGVGWA